MDTLDTLLDASRERGCSDIHLNAGRPPMGRLDGSLMRLGEVDLDPTEIETLLGQALPATALDIVSRKGSVDLTHVTTAGTRYRVNICREERGMAGAFRVIPDKVPALDALGLPPVVASFAELSAGLVLVTGACGTGKSTTLAALVDRINRTRPLTILTLEDPVEFRIKSEMAQVIQRQIGQSVRSFSDGLRTAMRQDPNVIMVGELRDNDAMSLALEASSTGQLVLGTLHTRGAAPSIDRILDAFPVERHEQARRTLADNLKCVVSQRLVKAADGRGRRAAAEVLVVTPAIAQLIREGRTFQIEDAISTGGRHGMQLMDHSLLKLVRAGDADPEDACHLATNREQFRRQLPPHLLGNSEQKGAA